MKTETIVLNEARNVTLTAYIQETGGEFSYVSKRPAVLVLPGGGYQMCSDREADPVALAYAKAGFQAFVLRYSVGEHAKWPQPLEDYEQAAEMIRERADEWSLDRDRLAVIGFSAGGHLAGCAATMAGNKPDAVILGYAVLIGEDVRKCNPSAPDVISAVDRKTAPSFVFASRRDYVVPIENTTRYLQALAEHDVAFESHIYAYGPHGFSVADSAVQSPDTDMCPRIPEWVDDSIAWLKETMGDFGKKGMTGPVYRMHMSDDAEEYYSIDCSLPYLMKCGPAKEVIDPTVQMLCPYIGVEELTAESMENSLGSMTLRDLLEILQTPEAEREEMDARLRRIDKKGGDLI